MFLRCRKRPKDGKEHLYWSVVENRRPPRRARRALPRGTQRSAGGFVAQERRILRSAGRRSPPSGALPRRACPGRHRCRRAARRAGASLGDVVARAPAVGSVLAGLRAVAAAGPGHLLGRASARQPQRHALGPGAADPGALPAHRSRIGMAAAPALVRPRRTGRAAARTQAGPLRPPRASLARPVRREVRGAALRPGQQLLRERSA